jgi:hypothetical protein
MDPLAGHSGGGSNGANGHIAPARRASNGRAVPDMLVRSRSTHLPSWRRTMLQHLRCCGASESSANDSSCPESRCCIDRLHPIGHYDGGDSTLDQVCCRFAHSLYIVVGGKRRDANGAVPMKRRHCVGAAGQLRKASLNILPCFTSRFRTLGSA